MYKINREIGRSWSIISDHCFEAPSRYSQSSTLGSTVLSCAQHETKKEGTVYLFYIVSSTLIKGTWCNDYYRNKKLKF